MAVSERLEALLEHAKVQYSVTKHPVAYTAQEIAASEHVSGRQLAKCVLVKTDRGPVLAVLPATQLVDLKRLKTLVGAKTLSIAKESDIKERFPDVEAGAMSPFGNLYQVPVVMDRVLGEPEEIVFNAGSHTETITMRYRDFAALAQPKVGSFGQLVGGRPAPKSARRKAATKRRTRPASARKARPKTSTRARKAAKGRR